MKNHLGYWKNFQSSKKWAWLYIITVFPPKWLRNNADTDFKILNLSPDWLPFWMGLHPCVFLQLSISLDLHLRVLHTRMRIQQRAWLPNRMQSVKKVMLLNIIRHSNVYFKPWWFIYLSHSFAAYPGHPFGMAESVWLFINSYYYC